MCRHICVDCRAKHCVKSFWGNAIWVLLYLKDAWLYTIIADKGLLSIILNIDRILIYVANGYF